jgi:hypothetical protein
MIGKFIIHMLAGIAYGSGAIWGIVERVDYFVNQDPVNWLFLIPLIGGIIAAFVNMILIMKD